MSVLAMRGEEELVSSLSASTLRRKGRTDHATRRDNGAVKHMADRAAHEVERRARGGRERSRLEITVRDDVEPHDAVCDVGVGALDGEGEVERLDDRREDRLDSLECLRGRGEEVDSVVHRRGGELGECIDLSGRRQSRCADGWTGEVEP